MSQYNIIHAKDPVTSLMGDSEQFTEIDPSLTAKFQYGVASVLAEIEWEDLPKVVPIGSALNHLPALKKMFLDLVIDRYEAELELLNSQEISYEFRDPRAFLESLPPPKNKEIPLLFDIQEEEDPVPQSHLEDAVENAIIEAAQDADSLPIMEGLNEESAHHMLVDPVAEYMEALIYSNAPALILRMGQIHQEWSLLMVTTVLKNHKQSTLWLSLTGSQCS